MQSDLAPVTPLAPSQQPDVLHCESTVDFLAALPFVTGFTHGNSLFVVLFLGKRAGDVLRLDLPQQDGAQAENFLDGLISLIRDTGAGAGSPAFVFMTSQCFGEQQTVPCIGLARRLEQRLQGESWTPRELAVVAADGWCGLLADGPLRARPLSEISQHPLAVRARSRHGAPLPLDQVGRLPVAESQRATAVQKHLVELEHRRLTQSAHPAGAATRSFSVRMLGASRVAQACFDHWDEGRAATRAREPLEPRLLARLIDAAQSPELWLVLALTVLTRLRFVEMLAEQSAADLFHDLPISVPDGTDRPGADAGPCADAGGPAWSIQQLLLSLSQEIPETRKLRRAIRVLEQAASHAPRDRRPCLLALLAWAWWMQGMQSISQRLIAQSLKIDSNHDLTLMVQRLSAAPPVSHLHRLRTAFDAA